MRHSAGPANRRPPTRTRTAPPPPPSRLPDPRACAASPASADRTPPPVPKIAKMPPPDAVDTAAALRLDVVQVRWRFAAARPSWAAADRTPIKSAPAEQEVVLQHGRLSGQQRVLLDGALVSSTQPAKRFADGGHTHAFAAAGGAACELRVVPRSTSVGGFEYTLRVDGTTVAAIPASSAVSLRTPRTAREAAAVLASQKKSARGRLAAELTRSPSAMKSSTPKERQDAARWAAEAAGVNGGGGYGDAPTGRTLDRIRSGSGGGSNKLWDAATAAAEQIAAARKTADAKTKEREQWEKRARDLWCALTPPSRRRAHRCAPAAAALSYAPRMPAPAHRPLLVPSRLSAGARCTTRLLRWCWCFGRWRTRRRAR